MIRVTHNQTVSGPVLVDDIDDGMPNKEVYRLGSSADPKAYKLDGYANKPKQPCYVAHSKLVDGSGAVPVAPLTLEPTWYPDIAGYIDLHETQRVTLSANKGKALKLSNAGLVALTSFLPTDVATPVLAAAVLGGGIITLTGTGFLSLLPDQSAVMLTGTGAVNLMASAIAAAPGGTFNGTTIVIPAGLCPGVVVTNTSAQVRSDSKLSVVRALTL